MGARSKKKSHFTSNDLAKMFDVSVGSINGWADSGKIPPVSKTPGGHRRFTQEHVDALNKLFNRQPAPPSSEGEAADAGQQ